MATSSTINLARIPVALLIRHQKVEIDGFTKLSIAQGKRCAATKWAVMSAQQLGIEFLEHVGNPPVVLTLEHAPSGKRDPRPPSAGVPPAP
nr:MULTISPECIES: hypothetical protein [unclassified Synechococcus]